MMPKLFCAFSAGEFLDESFWYGEIPRDWWEVYNLANPNHPFEWWILT